MGSKGFIGTTSFFGAKNTFSRTTPGFIKNHLRRGEWAEARFMIAAAEHGFNVSKPCGNSSRYDTVLELNGCFLRLQVKSTLCHNDRYYICSARTSSRPYTEKQVDFFAVYVIPEDLWYILPVRVVIRLKGNLLLAPHRKKHKYERYREAWDLLRVWKPKTRAAASSER